MTTTANPPLILLPGVCCDAWFFRHQAQAFARCRDGTPRHVIVPEWIAHVDLRDGTGCLQRVAARLASAWHEAGLDGAIVVGHSMGGVIGTLACGLGRFQAHSLLLLDTAIPVPASRRPFLQEMGTRMTACANADATAQREALGRLMHEYVTQHLASTNDDRDTLDQIIDRTAGADPERSGLLLQACAAIDLTPALQRVPCRISALAADPSRLPIDLFRAARPGAEVLQIHGIGHFVQVLAPQTINAAIACLLDDAPLRGAGMMPIAATGVAATA